MPSAVLTNVYPRVAGSSQKMPSFIGAVEDHWEMYSDSPEDYTIGSPIGFGASSIVYSAEYQPKDRLPPPIRCALKVLDLDSLPPHSLALLQRETTLMSLSKHPNVLRVRGSWIDGHKLYIAMRLMNKGSAADVMHFGWSSGLEEDIIKCILKQALQGLNYLHINGFIHRDVKAANLLIDDNGTVLLGDLGVAADLSEDSSRHMSASHSSHLKSLHQRTTSAASTTSSLSSRRVVVEPEIDTRLKTGKRKSFVGTPCWMAPELILGKQYDSSADIWSFGITALELSLGRPPRSRESPQKVLLRTIQDAPPTLDREGGQHKYSKGFQEMIESCLVKDPSKRPTARQLLESSFFKGTKKKSYLISKILKDLPPLNQRQERRVLPNSQTFQSIESWDFTTTVHSPTLIRTRISQDFAAAANVQSDTVFEMDDEREEGSRSPSRAVSFANEPTAVNEAATYATSGSDTPLSPAPIPTSPSDSETASAYSSPHTPPSLSNVEAKIPSDKEHEMMSLKAADLPPSSLLLGNKLHRLSSSPSQGGLWAKIKTATSSNVKRATSFSGKVEHPGSSRGNR
ncbi:ste ste20 fray protein kinase [Moniliophthora roreri MCA 2997]|uniref:Ste ste20 fray protein kinase n=1 Tax=Moniliophthora roreri (strain MCA 2997) TaxID=1381753 RepID=V2Z2M5_MONRO|nr:ste ste20 fray protein kinase [Moniliophthora roreri MCA 2997]